jgi:L-asparaginase
MARVVAIFTGGTISMVRDEAAGGNVPTLEGSGILALTPGLDEIATVVPVDLGRTPASHFTFPALFHIADAARSAAADPSTDGVVIVQGTDTLEETAFFYDLLLATDKPVVVTGAMRSASQAGYDGPANLRDAVAAAVSPALQGQGVVAVLGGSVHGADAVAKTHTSSITTFQSPDLGPLGHIDGGRVHVARRRMARRHVDATRASEHVPLLTATVAMDASLLDAAVASGAEGVVVAATGSGNTSPGLLDAASRAMDRGVPVVLASRCLAGHVGDGYAFPGGGATWIRAGALPTDLPALKARVALALGIGADLERPALAALLAGPEA